MIGRYFRGGSRNGGHQSWFCTVELYCPMRWVQSVRTVRERADACSSVGDVDRRVGCDRWSADHVVAEEHRDRRSEWWRRATWAFERAFSSDDTEAALGWKMLDSLLQSKLATRGDSDIAQVIGEHPALDEVEDLGTTWKRGECRWPQRMPAATTPRSRRRVVAWLSVRPLPARPSPPARRPGVP